MRGTPVTYFNSLNRYFNVCGVDRQMFYLLLAFCLPIAISARLMPLMDGVALVMFLMLYTIGVLVTRADNQIMALFRRHLHYKKHYVAIPGIHAKTKMIKPSVPVYQGKRGLV